jgi:hypothetical protein
MKDCAIKTMRVNQMKNMLCLHFSLKGNVVVAAVKLGTRLSNANPRRIQMIGQMMCTMPPIRTVEVS